VGPGSALLTLNGKGATRLISGGVMTISGLTFQGGKATGNGGAILASSITATDCVFKGNTASGNGGAISTSGNISLTNAVFTGNSAKLGGAIYDGNNSASTATFINCVISANSASSMGGGAYLTNSTVSMTGMAINGNSALWGGGLWL